MLSKKSVLYVAGSFNDDKGKESKIAKTIFEAIAQPDTLYINGGNFTKLEELISRIQEFGLIYWFADVPNDKPKLISEIKKKNKACVLVTSKRNVEKKYDLQEMLYHALGNKSNLFLEITKNEKYFGRVIDPLGNVFLDYNDNFSLVGKAVEKRANELLGYTRVSSEKCGETMKVPDEKEFFHIIKGYADTFHSLVHANPKATNRFFGNASFKSDLIYVTKRNIDKRDINNDGFVAVKQTLPVQYFGDHKPSVDSPTQISLYNYYPNIKYMLHSHVYIKNAPYTEKIMPCGALEEVGEINNLFPERETVNFFVNLKGHGSLALTDNIGPFKNIQYTARKIPEVHK